MNKRKGGVVKFSRTVAKAMYENTLQDRRLERSHMVIDKTKHRARCDINSQIYALRAEMLRIRACTPNIGEAIMENARVPIEERGKNPDLRNKLKPKGKEDQPHFRMSSATNKRALERINALTSNIDQPLDGKPCETPTPLRGNSPEQTPRSVLNATENHRDSKENEDQTENFRTLILRKIENENDITRPDTPSTILLTRRLDSEDKPQSNPLKKNVIIRTDIQSPRGRECFRSRPNSSKKTVIIQSRSMQEFEQRARPASSLSIRSVTSDRPGSRTLEDRPQSRASNPDSTKSTQGRSGTPSRKPKLSAREKLDLLNPNKHAHLSAARIHRETRLNTNLTMQETLCTLQPRLMNANANSKKTGILQTGALLAKIVKADNPDSIGDSVPDVERRKREVLEITRRLEELYSTPPPWAVRRSSSRKNSIKDATQALVVAAARPTSSPGKRAPEAGKPPRGIRPAETAFTDFAYRTARF
jgi:hypothetical protein